MATAQPKEEKREKNKTTAEKKDAGKEETPGKTRIEYSLVAICCRKQFRAGGVEDGYFAKADGVAGSNPRTP